jgi:hypothetical protein
MSRPIDMEYHSTKLTSLIAAAVISFALAGCDKPTLNLEPQKSASAPVGTPNCKTDVAEWTEGVKLFSGDEVTVWRRAVRCKSGFSNSSRGRLLEFELKYEPKGVHWKAPSGLDPASFEIIDGVPYLTLYVMTGGYCKGKPSNTPTARVMKWVDGKWVELSPSEFPFDRALLNLHTNYWGYKANNDAKGFIPADGKETGYKQDMTLQRYFGIERNQCISYEERVEPMSKAQRDQAASTNQR